MDFKACPAQNALNVGCLIGKGVRDDEQRLRSVRWNIPGQKLRYTAPCYDVLSVGAPDGDEVPLKKSAQDLTHDLVGGAGSRLGCARGNLTVEGAAALRQVQKLLLGVVHQQWASRVA